MMFCAIVSQSRHSLAAGANDAQKTAGVILTVLAAAGQVSPNPSQPEQYVYCTSALSDACL
jgi:hypothetical protein